MKNYFILQDQDECPVACVKLDGIDSTIINVSGETVLHIKYDGNCNGVLIHGVSKESYAKMCEKFMRKKWNIIRSHDENRSEQC